MTPRRTNEFKDSQGRPVRAGDIVTSWLGHGGVVTALCRNRAGKPYNVQTLDGLKYFHCDQITLVSGRS
jgi:hypothetical protein